MIHTTSQIQQAALHGFYLYQPTYLPKKGGILKIHGMCNVGKWYYGTRVVTAALAHTPYAIYVVEQSAWRMFWPLGAALNGMLLQNSTPCWRHHFSCSLLRNNTKNGGCNIWANPLLLVVLISPEAMCYQQYSMQSMDIPKAQGRAE